MISPDGILDVIRNLSSLKHGPVKDKDDTEYQECDGKLLCPRDGTVSVCLNIYIYIYPRPEPRPDASQNGLVLEGWILAADTIRRLLYLLVDDSPFL